MSFSLKKAFGYNHRAERNIINLLKMIEKNKQFMVTYYQNKLKKKFHIIIGDDVRIGRGFRFPHPQNIVIGNNSIIGENSIIYQDVTIGKKDGGYPTIGDHVTIYPGAKIIGKIVVGSNSVIGANAVVLKDVPPNSIVAGIPAKVIKQRESNAEYK